MNEELLNEFSNILKEKNINLDDLLGSVDNSNKSDSETNHKTSETTSNSSFSFDSIDLSTLLKFKTIFDKYQNSTSQNVQLLTALKPFMKDSRKAKIEQYTKILKIAEIFENLDLLGGDNNVLK